MKEREPQVAKIKSTLVIWKDKFSNLSLLSVSSHCNIQIEMNNINIKNQKKALKCMSKQQNLSKLLLQAICHKYCYFPILELCRSSTDDQANLEKYVNELKSSANYSVFFRPLSDTHSENFLLVYQTKCQQDLMRRYGNEICLLDATYKTTRYSLPMFFLWLCLQTHVIRLSELSWFPQRHLLLSQRHCKCSWNGTLIGSQDAG